MSDPEQRLLQLEQRVTALATQVEQLQATLALVGDVQRYSRLRELLASGELDGADRETARLFLDQLQDRDGDVSPETLERCPAPMLQIIDGLWSMASGGRQGFAVQQRTYRELGGSRNSLIAQDTALFGQFTARVAWPLLEGAGFALPEAFTVPVATALNGQGQPPPGHLPLRCWASDYGLKAANLLMARLIEVFAT